MTVINERLRKAIDRAAGMSEADQEALAAALERLIGAFTTEAETSEQRQHAPALRPELATIVEQSLREHAETLEYLKDR